MKQYSTFIQDTNALIDLFSKLKNDIDCIILFENFNYDLVKFDQNRLFPRFFMEKCLVHVCLGTRLYWTSCPLYA